MVDPTWETHSPSIRSQNDDVVKSRPFWTRQHRLERETSLVAKVNSRLRSSFPFIVLLLRRDVDAS